MKKGKLLILNGGSSAGKTSLGQALQDIMEEPYLLLGIDLFWFTLPPRQLDLERVEPEYYSCREETHDGKKYFRILPGPILDRVMYGRYQAIAVYLDLGFNVIADDVIWKPEWLVDALQILAPYEVTFVGVHVSDKEGSRRETVRGDRHEGWNRGSAKYAHHNAPMYDLEIDTTADTPEGCARKLKAALNGLKPRAFEELRKKLHVG